MYIEVRHLHIVRYIAVKPGAINSEVIGICLIEKNHAYLIKYTSTMSLDRHIWYSILGTIPIMLQEA